MDYKLELKREMETLARDPRVVFVGYGLSSGWALGTLKDVPREQIIETPTAENLMTGLAIGLSLAGRRPVVFFERMDFILNAADAIVNHLDKIDLESEGQFKPAVILRVVVGNRAKPLFTGSTHTQDFSCAFRKMVSFPVVQLDHPAKIAPAYAKAGQFAGSSMLVEYKDLH